MSFGYCPFTTTASLKAADKILGPDRVWTGNARQRDWLIRFYEEHGFEVTHLKMRRIERVQ